MKYLYLYFFLVFVVFVVFVVVLVFVVMVDVLMYFKDVVLIFFEYCLQCYCIGEIVLMLLMFYKEVCLWVKLIVCQVENCDMFFWSGDLDKYVWVNDILFFEEKIVMIFDWV